MSELKKAFASAREDGSILPVFDPFMAAELFVVGTMGRDGRPNLALKNSPIEGKLCATIAEKRAFFSDLPANRVLAIRPEDLLHLLDGGQDIVIVYQDGGDVLEAEYVEAFREAIT